MKTMILLIVVVVITIAWVNRPLTPPTGNYNQHHLSLKNTNDYRCDNLQLYPVYASSAFIQYYKNLGPYLSMEEALAQEKMLITEYNSNEGTNLPPTPTRINRQQLPIDDARVNTLFVENISADTIIILGGELIRGGKQDRMIAQDFMLPPHSGKIDVGVYCVEHGRWSAPNEDVKFKEAMPMAPNKVRKAGSKERNQQKVWEEVEDISAMMDLKITTGALAHAMNSEEFNKVLQKYADCYKTGWPDEVVGVVAVMGDEIVGCDLFASPTLFNKYFPSLLKSYTGNAASAAKEIKLNYMDVDQYLKGLLDETQQEALINEKGTQLVNGKYKIHISVF